MSRRHAWHDALLRRTAAAVTTLETLGTDLHARTTGARGERGTKRPRLFEEYQMQQWMLESMKGIADSTEAEEGKLAAATRALATKTCSLERDVNHLKVCSWTLSATACITVQHP